MVAVLIVILLLLLVILLLFTVKAKVVLSVNTGNMEMRGSFLWLFPLFRADFIYENSKPALEIYLFNRKIYTHRLRLAKRRAGKTGLSKLEMIRSIALSDVDVKASYGFFSPFATGIVCGTLGIITQYVNIDSFEQIPDFEADEDYIYIHATAYLDMGSTLINLIRAYGKSSSNKLSYGT
jgi:hypothetical protein